MRLTLWLLVVALVLLCITTKTLAQDGGTSNSSSSTGTDSSTGISSTTDLSSTASSTIDSSTAVGELSSSGTDTSVPSSSSGSDGSNNTTSSSSSTAGDNGGNITSSSGDASSSTADISSTGAASSTASSTAAPSSTAPEEQPPATCDPVTPPSNGIFLPMYLIDQHTHGESWNVDFFMTDGFRSPTTTGNPAFCSGDLPLQCTLSSNCNDTLCNIDSITGLALNQVQNDLGQNGELMYRNNLHDTVDPDIRSNYPSYVAAVNKHSIHSATTFQQWFKLTSEQDSSTKNFVVRDMLFQKVAGGEEVLIPGNNGSTTSPSTYIFSCPDPCFPLDGLLFGNENTGQAYAEQNEALSQLSKQHNYGFTGMMHGAFTARGSGASTQADYITLYSTDDSFLFIDNQLVFDMGGLHETITCRSINLRNGAITGGTAERFNGTYTCPVSIIPQTASSSKRTPYSPSAHAAGSNVKFSVYFTQRSAPRALDVATAFIRSEWRIETNVDLKTGDDTTQSGVVNIPQNVPAPIPSAKVSQPTPTFAITQVMLDGPWNAARNDSSSVVVTKDTIPNIDRDGLSLTQPLTLHLTEKPSALVMISLNTIPTTETIVSCTDGNITTVQVTFRACTSILSRVVAFNYIGLGEYTITCTAHTGTVDDISKVSNFDQASQQFKLICTEDIFLPRILLSASSFSNKTTSEDGSTPPLVAIELNGASSYASNLGRYIKEATWTVVVYNYSVVIPIIFSKPDHLVTKVTNLAQDTDYVFQLAVVDDTGRVSWDEIEIFVSSGPAGGVVVHQKPSSSSSSSTGSNQPNTTVDEQLAVLLSFSNAQITGASEYLTFLQTVISKVNQLESGAPISNGGVPSFDVTGKDSRLTLAVRDPYQIAKDEEVQQVNLTFIISAAVAQNLTVGTVVQPQPTSREIGESIIKHADPSGEVNPLRTQFPSLKYAMFVPIPALSEIQTQPTTPESTLANSDTASSSDNSGGGSGDSYSHVGLGVGLTLAVLVICIALAVGACMYRRHRQTTAYRKYETESMMAPPKANALFAPKPEADAIALDHEIHNRGGAFERDTQIRPHPHPDYIGAAGPSTREAGLGDAVEWRSTGLDHSDDLEMQKMSERTSDLELSQNGKSVKGLGSKATKQSKPLYQVPAEEQDEFHAVPIHEAERQALSPRNAPL